MAHLTLVPRPPELPHQAELLLVELSELLDTLRSKSLDDLETALEAAKRRREFTVIVGGGSSPCDERPNKRVGVG